MPQSYKVIIHLVAFYHQYHDTKVYIFDRFICGQLQLPKFFMILRELVNSSVVKCFRIPSKSDIRWTYSDFFLFFLLNLVNFLKQFL